MILDHGSEKSFGERKDDLYLCLRSFLLFGRWIGVISISGLNQRDVNSLHVRKCSLSFAAVVLLILWCTVNIGVCIVYFCLNDKRNPSDIAWNLSPLLFYVIGFYIYCYYTRYANELIALLQSWNSVSCNYSVEDVKLKRDMKCIAAIIFTSCVLENFVWHLKAFPVFDEAEIVMVKFNISEDAFPLEVCYYRGYKYWGKLVPYNHVLGVLVFIGHKFVLYAWNYSDIFIPLFSRAFEFKFRSLVEFGAEKVKNPIDLHNPHFWENLVQDHSKLCGLFDDFSKFMSPLIFLAFSVNSYYTCLQLHISLTPAGNNSFGAALYSVWSMVHITTRVLFGIVYASRMQENAVLIVEIFRKCPPHCYSIEVERVERSIQNGRFTGFHGMNCFFITTPFVLSFFSVIMVFEIVLLQATATMP